MKNLTSNIIEVDDSLEAANDWFCREKLSDGLPIVPPTAERVGRMLDGTRRDPEEVIGLIPPKWAPATIEKIAINAVMAGCLPEYLPVIIAAVEAICEPRFNLYGVQATTGYVGPALLLNGPIRTQLNVNCDSGVFGPGFRSNATIGRAMRLILITGGGTPLIALGIEDAEIMARDGITKKQVKDYLWAHASLKFAEIPARRKGHKSDDELLKDAPHVTPDMVVHLSSKPEDIMVIIVG